mmetsp:Transcript_47559/g.113051  ORF Transcript_47559/g.113051 Transcript_47559/m.113051 type:complete len:705 (-) Transcript_47559:33-2147(-)
MPVPKLLDSLSLPDLKDLLAAANLLAKFGFTKVDDTSDLISSLEKALDEKSHRENAKYKAWKQKVKVPDLYQERSSTIADTANRGITLAQLQAFGNFVEEVVQTVEIKDRDGKKQAWKDINLYTICNYFVLPLTEKRKCSFVELTATGDQVPLWFISHYWGTAFRQTLGMLAFHSQERKVPSSSAYWMCTFANNQHDLGELSGNLDETPFIRVLRSKTCRGTVALMDRDATPFRRIWCILEAFESTKYAEADTNHHWLIYDVAAWLTEGQLARGDERCQEQAVLLMNATGEAQNASAEGCWSLPFEVAQKAARTDVRTAQASREDDARVIRAYMFGKEDDFNRIVASPFANRAMRKGILHNAEELKWLLSEFPAHMDAIDSGDGHTPMSICVYDGRLDTLKLLLESKANPNAPKRDGGSPVYLAVDKNLDALKMLIAAKGDVNQARPDGWTPIHRAAETNNPDAMKILLGASGAKPNLTKSDGASPIYVAVDKGMDTLKVLIDAKADVNQPRKDGWTPIHRAARTNNADALKLLLAAPKANVNLAKEDGGTPLYAAVDGGVDGLKALIAAKADVNQARTDGWTPIHRAAEMNNVDALQVLLAAPKADINLTKKDGATPLYVAVDKGLEALHVLIASKADVNKARSDGWAPIHRAAETNNVDVLKALLAAKVDVGKTLADGTTTALARANKKGHKEFVALLEAAS